MKHIVVDLGLILFHIAIIILSEAYCNEIRDSQQNVVMDDTIELFAQWCLSYL